MISSDVIFGVYNSREDLNLTFTHADKGLPEVHTEYVEVPGRPPVDLSELAGNVDYENRQMSLEFEYIGPDWETEKNLVASKLHGRKMDIQFLNEPEWMYRGRCFVTSEVNGSTLHFTIDVTADPYKRIIGEVPTVLTGAGTIENPTDFASRPLIRVNGTGDGTVTIGNKTITLTDIDGYIDIDSMLMDCYKGTLNENGKVQLSEFPKLKPGVTGISFDGDVDSVEITGRWWTI